MTVHLLDEQQAALLRAAPLTYVPRADPAPGAPAGFSTLNHRVVLDRRDFDAAAADLLEWRMHARAGLRVAASDVPLRDGTVVLLRWGPGRLSMKIPCRVVEVVDEPRRRGFAYGTLPGHPEAGEERFLLEHLSDGRIAFTVSAFSRPASLLARWGGPLSAVAQTVMTKRYLTALDRL